MALSSKNLSRTNNGAGNIRAALGAGLFGWGMSALGHGPALAGQLHAAGLDAGAAVGLAFGLELAAVVAGAFLMEPLTARLLRRA